MKELPPTLLECLKSDDEEIRVAGVMQVLWQGESTARTANLALANLKNMLGNIGLGDQFTKDIFSILGTLQNLTMYLSNEQAALAPVIQSALAEDKASRPLLH